MNCIQPCAPAVEVERLRPKSVSILLIAASTAGPRAPSRYLAAACW